VVGDGHHHHDGLRRPLLCYSLGKRRGHRDAGGDELVVVLTANVASDFMERSTDETDRPVRIVSQSEQLLVRTDGTGDFAQNLTVTGAEQLPTEGMPS